MNNGLFIAKSIFDLGFKKEVTPAFYKNDNKN